MKNSYNQAREKAEAEIKTYNDKQNIANADTGFALVHLQEYLEWYKIKYNHIASGHIQDVIIKEVIDLFGKNVDRKALAKYLNKKGMFTSANVFFTLVALVPLITVCISYYMANTATKGLLILYIVMFVLTIIVTAVWSETNMLRFYRTNKKSIANKKED